jgi:hypothetical protein
MVERSGNELRELFGVGQRHPVGEGSERQVAQVGDRPILSTRVAGMLLIRYVHSCTHRLKTMLSAILHLG